MKSVFLISLFLTSILSCFSQASKINYKSIWSGRDSEQYEEKFLVIKNDKDYTAMWDLVKDFNKPVKPDSVDFSRYIVVAYFAGDQTNGTEVKKVEKTGNEITVTYSRLSYDRNCHDAALLVTPYTIIILEDKNSKIKYLTDVKIVKCDQ